VVGGGENEVAGVQGGRLNPLSPFLHTSPLHVRSVYMYAVF
jgi:hypothetical protein